jgi:hypothetical protein
MEMETHDVLPKRLRGLINKYGLRPTWVWSGWVAIGEDKMVEWIEKEVHPGGFLNKTKVPYVRN